MKTSEIVKYILLALGLCLIQFIVLDKLQLSTYLQPQILVLIPLILPIQTRRPSLFLIAFAIGMIADFFLNTFGLNTFCMVLVAYLRSFWLPKEDNPRPEFNVVPSLQIVLNPKWISYILILSAIYHFSYFILEYMAIKYFFRILLTALLSTALSIFVQWIIYQLFLKNRI
ncbi:hypothetical protein OAB01_00445 [Bacteroidia bacterium]|nr:hypothetical protein [Bacteroidia bacterium]